MKAFVIIWLALLVGFGVLGTTVLEPDREPERVRVYAAPSLAEGAWLGTDDRGRDVLARAAHGAGVALLLGAVALIVYLPLGVAVGVGAGMAGQGSLGELALGRLIELGLSVPILFVLLAWRAVAGPSGVVGIGVGLGLVMWPYVARLVRAETKKVVASEHFMAARALGLPAARIVKSHVLPLAIRPALVVAAFAVGQATLFEASLGALGLGLAAPTATWGELLAQAMAQPRAWWLWATPTLAIALTVATTQHLSRQIAKHYAALT